MGESYAGAIGTDSPRQAADLLRARLQGGRRANERLAEWVHDYTQLMTRQAAELERFISKHVVDDASLGTLAQPWQAVAQLVLEQARSTADATRRAQVETERPLRDTHWSQAERVLEQLESGAVSVQEGLDRLQELDLDRLAGIKTALARFGTIEVDRAQAQTGAAEHAAQAWLAYEPHDDIAAYVAQVVSGVAPAAARQDSQRHASSATQASTQSSSTVRRKSSLRFGSSSGSGSGAAAGAGGTSDESRGLRSKVGSLFGRKKKSASSRDSKLITALEDADGASTSSLPRTRPPDFGLRAPSPIRRESQSSVRTGLSNTSDLYSQPSPRRPGPAPGTAPNHLDIVGSGSGPTGSGSGPIGSGPASAGAPQSAAAQPGYFNEPPPQSVNFPPANNSMAPPGMVAPLTPTKVNPPSRGESPSGSPGSSPRYAQYGSPTGSLSSPAGHAASAPAPPPARQSMLGRAPSLGRTPSNASASAVQRSASLQRTPSQRERVNSQLFANMQPTDTGSSSAGQMAPIPATPQKTPGSPQEQFWTPAARFPSQFTQFDANSSMLSLSARPAELPLLPRGRGLVAAAVERVSATFDGEDLVSSSVLGEAVAQINDTDATLALGVLLADPNAKLTPSSNLVQTSSLSFEVPAAVYGGVTQDLVTYEVGTAIGRIPIKVVPLWRVEPTMVRLVLSYQLSDLYVGGDAVEIQDLVIAVSITGPGKAHSAQSKPVATFSCEKQRVTWRLNQPQVLRRGQPAQKLLAQFVTDGHLAVEPGTIDIRVKVPQLSNPVLQLRTLTETGDWVPVPTAVAGSVVADVHNRSGAAGASPTAPPQTTAHSAPVAG